MTPTPAQSRPWTEQGTLVFGRLMTALSDDAASLPSGLPGWSRKHLIAHVCANADALMNLSTWAATGAPTPMYASAEQRAADIERGATESMDALRRWFDRSVANLEAKLDGLTERQWQAEVRTAQGRTVPATIIPWLRAREVQVHATDLAMGLTFADLPADFCAALCDDIVLKRSTSAPAGSTGADLVLEATDRDLHLVLRSTAHAGVVRATLAEVTAYLAGRPTARTLRTTTGQAVPALGPWL